MNQAILDKVQTLPQTYWKYRRLIAFICLVFGIIYALAALVVFDDMKAGDFSLVSFSIVFYLFLLVPIIIYMTGANREDLEKIKGIIEVLKK